MFRRIVSTGSVGAVALGGRSFSVTVPLRYPTDPAELEREQKLREKLMNNPRAMFGGAQAQHNMDKQQADSTSSSSDSNQSSASSDAGTPKIPPINPFGNFSQQFQQFHKIRNAQRAAAAAQAGPQGQVREVSLMKFLASCVMLYAAFRMFLKTQGADLNATVVPYWVTSYETQAKYLLLTFVMDKQTKERHQQGFAQARRQQPLLNFFDYLDQVEPYWCCGMRYPKDQVLKTFTGALCTLSQWQVVSLTNRIEYTLRSHTAGSVAEKVDAMMDVTNKHLGSGRSFMANLVGSNAEGGVPVLRLSNQGGTGPMTLTDSAGHTMPVAPASTVSPVILSQRSFPATGEHAPPIPGAGPGTGMPPQGGMPPQFMTPRPATIGGPGMGQPASSPGSNDGDTLDTEKAHGTIPVFKS